MSQNYEEEGFPLSHVTSIYEGAGDSTSLPEIRRNTEVPNTLRGSALILPRGVEQIKVATQVDNLSQPFSMNSRNIN
jgi:hypothetical protein